MCRYDALKEQGLKEERVLLLEAWRECERDASNNPDIKQKGDVSLVDKLMPRKVKMRRPIPGNEEEFEDFYDYHFPDAEKPVMGMKILEKAMMWKQQMNLLQNQNNTSDSGAQIESNSVDKNDIDIDDI